MHFANLFGHSSAIRAIQRALSEDRLVSAYLLVGPPGIGKTTLAQAFAAAAACRHPRLNPFDSCGECESCRRVQINAHPEILLIPPAGEQTQIWQFWDREGRPPGLLQHTLPFAPAIGRRRVYIIERAETLNVAAANSLLKVLEEPPPYALFLLLASHPDQLLPTILSRVQRIRLLPAPMDSLATYLTERIGVSPKRARALAMYAEGRVGIACRLAQNHTAQEEIARMLELAEQIPNALPLHAPKIAESMRKLASSLKGLSQIEPSATDVSTKTAHERKEGGNDEENGASPAKERVGRRQLAILLEMLIAFYRDLLALSLSREEANIVHDEQRSRLLALATQKPPPAWMACLETLSLARRRLDQNASVPILTDWLAIRLVQDTAHDESTTTSGKARFQ